MLIACNPSHRTPWPMLLRHVLWLVMCHVKRCCQQLLLEQFGLCLLLFLRSMLLHHLLMLHYLLMLLHCLCLLCNLLVGDHLLQHLAGQMLGC